MKSFKSTAWLLPRWNHCAMPSAEIHGVDSLNVAAASAVAFWELR